MDGSIDGWMDGFWVLKPILDITTSGKQNSNSSVMSSWMVWRVAMRCFYFRCKLLNFFPFKFVALILFYIFLIINSFYFQGLTSCLIMYLMPPIRRPLFHLNMIWSAFTDWNSANQVGVFKIPNFTNSKEVLLQGVQCINIVISKVWPFLLDKKSISYWIWLKTWLLLPLFKHRGNKMLYKSLPPPPTHTDMNILHKKINVNSCHHRHVIFISVRDSEVLFDVP